jgi:hypothetical protein
MSTAGEIFAQTVEEMLLLLLLLHQALLEEIEVPAL